MAQYVTPRGVVVEMSDAAARSVGYKPAGQTATTSEGYAGRTVDELKDEIRSRNEDRDDDARLPLTGTKAELVAALEADDK
jgi:hypothetical protein